MKLIDVHTHYLPSVYLGALDRAGIVNVDGFPMPKWSEDEHLAIMERNGISTSVLSISSPAAVFLDGQAGRDLARAVNEAGADLAARRAGRFGTCALLPLPDVEGALREIEFALDELKLDGVGLLTNVNGTYLGAPEFDAVFAELDRRGAVVFVHPTKPPVFEALSLGFPAPAIEYPFDTTRMIMNLIASGTLRRFPNMRVIVSHGGGTVPFLATRMTNLLAMFSRLTPPMAPAEAVAQLRSLYYDVTAVSHAQPLATIRKMVPLDRLLYGSDTPFMPEFSIPPALAALRSPEGYEGESLAAVEYGNAIKLFPRFA